MASSSSGLLLPSCPPLLHPQPRTRTNSFNPVPMPREEFADLISKRSSISLHSIRIPATTTTQLRAIAFGRSGQSQVEENFRGDTLETKQLTTPHDDDFVKMDDEEHSGVDEAYREDGNITTALAYSNGETWNMGNSEVFTKRRKKKEAGQICRARSEIPRGEREAETKDLKINSGERDDMRTIANATQEEEDSRGQEKNEAFDNFDKTEEAWSANGKSLRNSGSSEQQSGASDAGEKSNAEPIDIADREEDAMEQITKIPVPRQKYIPVSKVALVTSLAQAFDNDTNASEFLSICSFLESILHAEHKRILEEMRLDYRMTRSSVRDTGQNGPIVKEEAEHLNGSVSRKTKAKKKTAWLAKMAGALSPFKRGGARRGGAKVTGNGKYEVTNPSLDQQGRHSLNGSAPGLVNDTREEDTNGAAIHGSKNGVSSSNNQMDTASSSGNKVNEYVDGTIRNSIAAAARFQRNFMQLLRNAQFQGLSARDLQLTSALNTDYLLTLPVDVDWKRASSANAVIFRRGYAAERQEGLLFGAKLDYLQSLLLRKMFNWFSRPLFRTGTWINQKWKQLGENEDSKIWAEGIKEWLKEPLKPDMEDDLSGVTADAFSNQQKESDLPIWIAAQQAVPRYEAFLSSAGSRGMLLRRVLVWMRLLPSKSADLSVTFDNEASNSEPHLRGNYLARISMRDIWLPASKIVCGRSVWRRVRAAFSVFFSRSTLQEPAFKELVLFYNAPKASSGDAKGEEIPKLQLKIYKRIPIPDLKVIFPNKKLSFRILDTVRLDIATIVGLLAFLVNYRFDDVLSSPSAFLLDVIASSALIVYMTRVVLGYKQTWDRYQLLVNKTLYEKTLASGFGAVHFLVDASEQQKFKEVVLAFALLMQAEKCQVESRKKLADMCERFLYSHFKEQIEMPVDNAVRILLRLGLVVEGGSTSNATIDGDDSLGTIKALPYVQSVEVLKDRWSELLYDQSIWSSIN